MDIETFTGQFADAIEVPADSVTPATKFRNIQIWDSLCVLNIIAMVDTFYNVSVSGDDLQKGGTVLELFNLVESRVK